MTCCTYFLINLESKSIFSSSEVTSALRNNCPCEHLVICTRSYHKQREGELRWYGDICTSSARANNPYAYCNSPIIRTTLLTGLVAGMTYFSQSAEACKVWSFNMTPAVVNNLFKAQLVTDLGTSDVSAQALSVLSVMLSFSVSLSVCLSLFLSLSVSLRLCVSLSLSLFVSLCLCLSLSLFSNLLHLLS